MTCFRLEYSILNDRGYTEFRTVKWKYVLPYNISNIGLYMGYQADYFTTHDYQLTDSAKLLRALKVHDHVSLGWLACGSGSHRFDLSLPWSQMLSIVSSSMLTMRMIVEMKRNLKSQKCAPGSCLIDCLSGSSSHSSKHALSSYFR